MANHHPADRGTYVPAHRPEGMPLRVLLAGLDEDEAERLQAWLRRPHLRVGCCDAASAPTQALRLLPDVLVVDAHEDARTQLAARVSARCRAVAINVLVLSDDPPSATPTMDGHRVHLQRPFDRAQLQQAVEQAAHAGAPATGHWHTRQLLGEADTLLGLALELAAPIALEELLQHCTDAARHLTGAAYAALFRHGGPGPHRLVGLAGLPAAAFHGLAAPGNTLLLAPTFAGERTIRCDDVQAHPRYGWNPHHRGVPADHPPVRSYLAVPVTTREGRLLGALLLGHGEPGVFTPHSERLAEAIAAQAAVAIEHHLHQSDGAEPDPDDAERRPAAPARSASASGREGQPRPR